MNHETIPAYGPWTLVVINSAVFIIFAYSFTKPRSPRDWRSFGGFSAFIVALWGSCCSGPTILTLAMFPLLAWMYVHLAHTEEREAQREFGAAYERFGAAYERYAADTPRWVPHWGVHRSPTAHPGA